VEIREEKKGLLLSPLTFFFFYYKYIREFFLPPLPFFFSPLRDAECLFSIRTTRFSFPSFIFALTTEIVSLLGAFFFFSFLFLLYHAATETVLPQKPRARRKICRLSFLSGEIDTPHMLVLVFPSFPFFFFFFPLSPGELKTQRDQPFSPLAAKNEE